MKPRKDLAGLVSEASLVIWDEAPMMSRHCFETLDRSMRDIIKTLDNTPFGGKVVVFGGDFRQMLTVIRKGSRTDIVMASLNSSDLWANCEILSLTKNMRLFGGISSNNAHEIKEFSEWILAIGDGRINELNLGDVLIDISEELLITDCSKPVNSIVEAFYGHGFVKSADSDFYKDRAILSPTNFYKYGCAMGLYFWLHS